MEIKNISKIQFGLYSPEEVLKFAICEINSNKLNGPNSVYDERMGCLENHKKCAKCLQDNKKCPGHFGYIALNYDIIHPLYYKMVVSFLKCFCYKCYALLINEDQLQLYGYNKYTGSIRFKKILEKLEKVEICPACQSPQPKISLSILEGNIYMTHKNKNEIIKTQIFENEIKRIFENILDSDIKLLGLDPKETSPRNLIISVLPVLPPVARPFIIAENITCDDDLTLQYIEIIKANNHLADNKLNETKRQKYIQSLKFRIKCLFDNSQEKAKHTNGRPMKGIKKRLSGKDGQIRSNIMGKRVNKSGRSVIGPDPTLKMEQLAVPIKMAQILTYPVRANIYNIKKVQNYVNKGKANFVIRDNGNTRINLKYALFRRGTELLYGDIIIRNNKELEVNQYNNLILLPNDKIKRNGKILEKLEYPKIKNFRIQIGDIVERQLENGDIVLLNRQPTLHKGSMLAQEVVIREGKTLRMNLAITKTFNADFDGDEMNIHIPASPETEIELRQLSASKYNMISTQSSKSNIVIVQDALLGAYLMTKNSTRIREDLFYQITSAVEDWTSQFILNKLKHIRKILKNVNKKIISFNGRGLFSLLLPMDLNYEKKNNANLNEPIVKIYRGVLYEGTINKSIIGSSHNSLIQILYKEYGVEKAVSFINNIQFIANAWLIHHSFSVGIADCIANKTEKIEDMIEKCFVEAKAIEETTTNLQIREIKITAALSKARDIGMKMAKDAFDENNNFISTVTSGSKGDFFNIAQITGILGQQNLTGKRIPYNLNKNTRSLPHYSFKNLNKEEEYESRGFIKHSFSCGLNPREFFFHAMTGREGITDTAMKTAQSGYIQRRMVKLAEDIKIQYDGTARNANRSIIQLQYGEDGLSADNTVIIDKKPQACDINRLIDRINTKFEIKEKIK